MSDLGLDVVGEKKPLHLHLDEETPYKQFFRDEDIKNSFIIEEVYDPSLYEYSFEEKDNAGKNSVISFDNTNIVKENSLVIDFEKEIQIPMQKPRRVPQQRYEPYTMVSRVSEESEERKNFNINISNRTGTSLKDWLIKKHEEDPGEAKTLPITTDGGGNYLARGGAPLVRRISASINNARARQTHVRDVNFNLHRSFFLIIWEHFAPNANIRERPRRYYAISLNVRLPPMYSGAGNRVCSVLLRCVRRDNNIAYSVLFEFTNNIHWSIFYSFDVDNHGALNVNTGQVSELHFTLNECAPASTPKTRMFFEYTDYINSLIPRAVLDHHGQPRFSSIVEQVQIMEIVSELMLLTMYQLVTAESYATGGIFHDHALNMRQHIDNVGNIYPDNQLLNIALRHVDLIYCIQQEFRRHPQINFASDGFINHLQTDISRAITAVATAAGPAGGKNINRYLTKINNIKEKLKLLKKNKVKNKVKITKLSKLIDELKAKLKKQKEKEKAKLKKQKEKEKAKLKKQKEKEKAKLKKQKEKDNVKRKKTKAKKS